MQLVLFVCLAVAAFAAADECPGNSHYESCGTACPLTCDNYQNPPIACVLMCNPGCHCDEGYVKTKDGRCVLPDQCESPKCPENSHYDSCGTACPLTCENYMNPPKICVLMCNADCHCDKGYVKTKDGRCVLPDDCERPVWEVDTNVCELPIKRGLCLAYIPRYAFNKDTGKCEKFIYGGCQGNGNNFKTLEECERSCEATQSALERPDCDKAPESGLCDAYMPRFYYDQEAGMCKKFIYGGCGGNRNNFASEFECYNKCGALAAPSACRQGKEVGACKGAFKRFYFNTETNKCEPFIYGGCQGNSNNFLTQEDCEDVCLN